MQHGTTKNAEIRKQPIKEIGYKNNTESEGESVNFADWCPVKTHMVNQHKYQRKHTSDCVKQAIGTGASSISQ